MWLSRHLNYEANLRRIWFVRLVKTANESINFVRNDLAKQKISLQQESDAVFIAEVDEYREVVVWAAVEPTLVASATIRIPTKVVNIFLFRKLR